MVGWESAKLGEVCQMIKRGVAPKYIDEGGICVINQKCVRNHAIDTDLARRHNLEAKKVHPDRYIQAGDVLVNSTGTGTLGRVAQVRQKPIELTTVDTHVTIVRPQPGKFFNDFFGYMLIKIEEEITSSGEGASGQTELARTVLSEKFTVSYPTSLPEQRRLVAILDEALAGIDASIANTKKNLANARALFASYLNGVFSQQGAGWEEKKLGDVCENLDSKSVPITKSKRKSGEIPYYGASGVVDHVADYLFDEDLLLVSEDGANLLARTYPIAFSVSGKTWVNNHAHVLRFETMAYQKFIEYYLNSISLEPYVSGMAQPKLNQKFLNSITVPWPLKTAGAAEVVEKLEGLSFETKRLETIYQQKLDRLAELKQAILHKAFAGELSVLPEKTREEAVA